MAPGSEYVIDACGLSGDEDVIALTQNEVDHQLGDDSRVVEWDRWIVEWDRWHAAVAAAIRYAKRVATLAFGAEENALWAIRCMLGHPHSGDLWGHTLSHAQETFDCEGKVRGTRLTWGHFFTAVNRAAIFYQREATRAL